MCKQILLAILGIGLFSCSPSKQEAAPKAGETNPAPTVNAIDRLDAVKARSCWSDADCGPDQNCECPLSGDNGNCEHPGVCVPRDKTIAAPIAPMTKAKTVAGIANCQSMRNLSFIPAGYHPVSAQWVLDAQGQINDLVCIAKTNSPQIRVLRWLDYPLPAGYHTLRVESGVDTTFRGCRQWSEWQGNRQCMTSFDLYVMQKDS